MESAVDEDKPTLVVSSAPYNVFEDLGADGWLQHKMVDVTTFSKAGMEQTSKCLSTTHEAIRNAVAVDPELAKRLGIAVASGCVMAATGALATPFVAASLALPLPAAAAITTATAGMALSAAQGERDPTGLATTGLAYALSGGGGAVISIGAAAAGAAALSPAAVVASKSAAFAALGATTAAIKGEDMTKAAIAGAAGTALSSVAGEVAVLQSNALSKAASSAAVGAAAAAAAGGDVTVAAAGGAAGTMTRSFISSNPGLLTSNGNSGGKVQGSRPADDSKPSAIAGVDDSIADAGASPKAESMTARLPADHSNQAGAHHRAMPRFWVRAAPVSAITSASDASPSTSTSTSAPLLFVRMPSWLGTSMAAWSSSWSASPSAAKDAEAKLAAAAAKLSLGKEDAPLASNEAAVAPPPLAARTEKPATPVFVAGTGSAITSSARSGFAMSSWWPSTSTATPANAHAHAHAHAHAPAVAAAPATAADVAAHSAAIKPTLEQGTAATMHSRAASFFR